AQGAYDEMVFRAKVRDGGRFFSPLGLESEAIQTDFQVGANSYLYGTRFFSYFALTYGVDRTVEWLGPGGGVAWGARGVKSLLPQPVQTCVRTSARRCVGRLDRVRAQVPGSQPCG